MKQHGFRYLAPRSYQIERSKSRRTACLAFRVCVSAEFIIARVHRSFFPAARARIGEAREYKDDDLRLSLVARRIDFTGFHERAQ